jgi:hypothetical protein
MKCPKCGAENLDWRYRCQQCGEILHPEYDKLPSFESSNLAIFLPFLLGLLGTVPLVFFVIWSSGIIAVLLYCLLAAAVAGLVICWKWPRVGGVLLVSAGLTLVVVGILTGSHESDMLLSLIFLGVPALLMLASGILMILLSHP